MKYQDLSAKDAARVINELLEAKGLFASRKGTNAATNGLIATACGRALDLMQRSLPEFTSSQLPANWGRYVDARDRDLMLHFERDTDAVDFIEAALEALRKVGINRTELSPTDEEALLDLLVWHPEPPMVDSHR